MIYFNDNLGPKKESKELSEYQVIIKLDRMPHNIRLTYKTNKTNTIIEVEELDALEKPICSCKFKGRSNNKDVACEWLKEIKQFCSQMKPNHWNNSEQFIDSYYKIH